MSVPKDKKMRTKRASLSLALLVACFTLASARAQDIPLPEVPLRVLREANERADRAVAEASATARSDLPEEPRPEQYPVDVAVQPGVNTIVTIAKGLMNRIVTPWTAPKVHTVNPAVVEVRGPVIYVATDHEEPIGLFITTDESEAYSLTLVPRSIPPRELRLGPADHKIARNGEEAARWETAQPYVETMIRALHALALGVLPSGYGERDPTLEDRALYSCAFDEGVNARLMRVTEGQRLAIGSLAVENDSATDVELHETLCYQPGVRAVAAWPNVLLLPGQSTRLFIVRASEPEAARLVRPAQLTGDAP